LSIDPFPDLGSMDQGADDFSNFENLNPSIGQPSSYGNLFDTEL